MKKLFYVLTVISLTILTACTTAPVKVKTVNQSFPKQLEKTEKTNIMDTATLVLMNNGFDIMFVNENLGIINTNWKDLTSKKEKNSNALGELGRALGGGTSSSSNTRMQIQFKLSEDNYKLLPKLERVVTQKGGFSNGTQSSNEIEIDENSDYGKLIEKITTEINTLTGIENNFIWDIKIQEIEQ